MEEGHLVGKSLCLILVLFLASISAEATAHVFIQTKEGVWLGSDSLNLHTSEGGKQNSSSKCKVVISRGRLIFNAGYFKDVDLLTSQEAALPINKAETTMDSILELLKTNHMDTWGIPNYTPGGFIVVAGILQVDHHVFTKLMSAQRDDFKDHQEFFTKMGVPYGVADSMAQFREAALIDPAIAAWITANPKKELLKILNQEATTRSDLVGKPFTIFLLHNDGTVSDYSDQPLCTIPADAVHVEQGHAKRVTSKR
jgi:hypothetical protein